jgi:predicted transcriptional regulator
VAKRSSQKPSSASDARSGLTQIMGDLEAEILECVWDMGSASVKDVHECLLVSRPVGRAYVYEAAAGREEFCAGVMRRFMSGVLVDADQAVLAQFVDSVTENDLAQLDLLAQIIDEKRRERSS